jgi:hypothetical protein
MPDALGVKTGMNLPTELELGSLRVRAVLSGLGEASLLSLISGLVASKKYVLSGLLEPCRPPSLRMANGNGLRLLLLRAGSSGQLKRSKKQHYSCQKQPWRPHGAGLRPRSANQLSPDALNPIELLWTAGGNNELSTCWIECSEWFLDAFDASFAPPFHFWAFPVTATVQ